MLRLCGCVYGEGEAIRKYAIGSKVKLSMGEALHAAGASSSHSSLRPVCSFTASVLGARLSLQPDVYLPLTRSLQEHHSITTLLQAQARHASRTFHRLTSHHFIQAARHFIARTNLSFD
jgi:hypothetical protein